MIELTPKTVRDYLVGRRRISADEPLDVTELTGGVSNVVYLVTPGFQNPFVLKQSRAQLRTEADWFSQVGRIFREMESQRVLSRVLPAGTVPDVLFEDRDNYCYAMSAVRSDHAVWKRQLLSGLIDESIFSHAGELLGEIHTRTAGQPNFLSEPHDTTVFFELRVDPFYRRIAAVHPDIRSKVDDLIGGMAEHSHCLVHADFSPKNLLVHPDGLTLVDHETVHYGDPAFDLGFFFSHLWLKAIALPNARSQLVEGIHLAWNSYRKQLVDLQSTGRIPFTELSQRAVLHLAGCLLARVDGKSPVDYLAQESQRAFVRGLALRWFQSPPKDLEMAFRQIESEMKNTNYKI